MSTQVRSESEIELADETSSTSITPDQNQQINLSPIIINTIKLSLKSVLTRFHAGYFRISLSLGGQALLWKALLEQRKQTNPLHYDLKLYPSGFLALWSISFFVLVFLSIVYILRCLFFFKMVKVEFLNHVGVNYLFAPWISWLLLLESSPFLAPRTTSYLILWCIFAIPVVILDIKIYGQWFTKGKRFLSAAANPTCQMSVIGNLVGAQAAANMGWKEIAVFLFSLGMVHYLVLLVTLYQRLSGSDHKLPAMLRPVFFLFIAAPSAASLAWEAISGAFDTASKMLFFLSLFLFTTLILRPMLFRRAMRRFNIAWWAYSFPITVLALASSEYAEAVKGVIPHVMMFLLLGISVLVFLALLVFTLVHSKMLLPDDDPSLILFDRLPTASL